MLIPIQQDSSKYYETCNTLIRSYDLAVVEKSVAVLRETWMPFVKTSALNCKYNDFCNEKITGRLDKR